METGGYTMRSSYIHPEEPITSRVQASSFKIFILISFKHVRSHWIMRERPQVVRYENPIEIDHSISFTLQEFLSHEQSRKTIEEIIKYWPNRNDFHRQFVDIALKTAREAIVSMPAHHNAVYLGFLVISTITNVFDQTRFLEGITQESTMVPTLDFCIENLERNVVVDHDHDHDHETCSICLEEFSTINGVRKGTCMPCSHIFHDDCIRKWLSTSHYCPICRFEMPTEEDA